MPRVAPDFSALVEPHVEITSDDEWQEISLSPSPSAPSSAPKLPTSPISVLPESNESFPELASAKKRDTELVPFNVAKLLLRRCTLRRIKETVFLFDGRIYRELDTNGLGSLITRVLEDKFSLVGNGAFLSSVMKFITVESGIEVMEEPSSRYVCVRNGVLDMESGALLSHNKDWFFTSFLDVEYDPCANVACPVFDNFLFTVAGGDTELVRRFWEALGYLLVLDTAGKSFIFMCGVPDSGKSLLASFIESFFNREAIANLPIFRLGDRFSTATLTRKRINVSMDLPNETLSTQAVGTLKMITGRDNVTIEQKFKDPLSAKINCKFLFGSNHPLRLSQADEALHARVVLLPFRYQVPKEQQDVNLLQRFEEEKPAVLRKALGFYSRLKRNAYIFSGSDRFGFDRQEGLFAVGNVESGVLSFLENCCVEGGESDFITSAELYRCYWEHCGHFDYPVYDNSNSFSKAFNRLCSYAQRDKQRVWGESCNGYRFVRAYGGSTS